MAYTFELTSADSFATIYDDESGRPAATIRRPYATRAAQKAVPFGDMWTVYGTDGACIMVRNLRPSRASIARAIDARRAQLAAEEAAPAPAPILPPAEGMARAMAALRPRRAAARIAAARVARALDGLSILPPAMSAEEMAAADAMRHGARPWPVLDSDYGDSLFA